MSKQPANYDLDDDLEADYAHASLASLSRRVATLEGRGSPQLATGDAKRLNKLEARLNTLEKQVEATGEELGEHSETLRQTREAYARNASAGEDAALGTLAKAASSNLRRRTPEGVVARASASIKDPSTYAMVETYARSGQLAKALDIVERAEQQATEADEDAALAHVERQVDKGGQLSELSGAVANLQATLESVSKRLAQLERRPQAPTPVPATVAKASGSRQRGAAVEYKDSVQGLATRLESAFDDPAQVGVYSSMLQSHDPNQIEQVRLAVEAAELAHESRARRGR